MSEIVDDLLNEVEQLESATKELESSTETVKQKQQTLADSSAKASSEAHLIALQTAKTAQEAASESQKAAEASIKQAEALKAEILELNESNFNWRQSVRNAGKDFKSAKSSMTIMLVTSIIFSLIAIGAAAYLLYSIKKQNEQYKGEVLDIIATENALLKKNITLKVDELAYVIENMQAPINQAALHMQDHKPSAQTEPAVEQPAGSPNEPALETTQPTEQEQTSEVAATETTDQKPAEYHEAAPMVSQSAFSSEEGQQLISSVDWIKAHAVTGEDLQKVKSLVADLQQQLIKLEQQSPTTTTSGLTADQIKKLDGIGWLVRKQSKAIEELEKQLSALQKPSVGKDYTQQFQSISAEQKAMKKQLAQIEKALDELTELSKEPPPYSYRAK